MKIARYARDVIIYARTREREREREIDLCVIIDILF